MTNFWTFILIAAGILVLGWIAYGIYLLWEKRQAKNKPQANKRPSQAQVQMEDYARKFQQQQDQSQPGNQQQNDKEKSS